MAIISLRDYVREIQGLIDGQNEPQAIEHSKHILKKFPKHLDTYRLLGQAYLEANRYQEAVDLFLRVLSVIPEDFIAHLGLSVVNEEENNLDAAIWHMERAYEVRSTETIHEELQRLFSMRDGFAPPKPYITRGALIRINIRSGLYQQALAEIQHALQEDPQRMDLLILRARIYFMQNNMSRSVETCKMILEKLPYSYDANSIMAEILGNSEKADAYKLRLHELDPYTTYVNQSTTIDQVSDHAVGIEHLDNLAFEDIQGAYDTTDNESFLIDDEFLTEEYSQTLLSNQLAENQLEEETSDDGNLALAFDHDPEETIMNEPEFEETPDDDLIPEWMKDAGWETGETRSEEEQQQQIQSYDDLAETVETGDAPEEIDESEIPEWLKSFSPPETFNDELPSEDQKDNEGDNLSWLNDIMAQEQKEQPSGKPGLDITDQEPEEPIDLPESLSQPIFGENIDADLEWLEEISSAKNSVTEEYLTKDHLDQQTEPDELDWITPAAEQTEAALELPTSEDIVETNEIEEVSIAETTMAEATAVISEGENEEEDFDFDSALAWLEGLAAKQGADEETLSTAPDSRQETAPEWITTQSHPETITKPEPESEDVDAGEYNPEMESVPDWLQEAEANQEMVELELESEIENESFEELPVWMKELSPPEHVEDETELVTEQEPIPLQAEPIEQIETNPEPVADGQIDEVEASIEEVPELSTPQDQMQSTAVLDFIKSTDDMAEDEIDQWLENLPDLDWGEDEKQSFEMPKETDSVPAAKQPYKEPSLEELLADELELVDEEIKSEKDEVQITPSTSFIDEFFAEDSVETSVGAADENDEPPYVWEQEFSGSPIADETEDQAEEELPDWIADIPDTNFLVRPEKATEMELPEEFVEEMDDDEPGEQGQLDETLPIPVAELFEESVPSTSVEEIQQHTLVEAKEWLTQGAFAKAHPILQNEIEKGHNLSQVVDTLLFDISHYHPIEVDSWILLGDAYFKQGDLAKALDAYLKAEDFVN